MNNIWIPEDLPAVFCLSSSSLSDESDEESDDDPLDESSVVVVVSEIVVKKFNTEENIINVKDVVWRSETTFHQSLHEVFIRDYRQG